MTEELHTPSHWETVTGVRIQAANGWTGKFSTLPEKSFEEPVTLEEFKTRAAHSIHTGSCVELSTFEGVQDQRASKKFWR